MNNIELFRAQYSSHDHYSVKPEDITFHPYQSAESISPTAINRKALPGQGFLTFKPASKRRFYMNPAAVAAPSNRGEDSDLERVVPIKTEPTDLPLTWISPGMTRTDKMSAAAKGRAWGRKKLRPPTPPAVQTKWRLQYMDQKSRLLVSPQYKAPTPTRRRLAPGPYPARASSSKLDTDIKVPKVKEEEEKMKPLPWSPARGPLLQADCESPSTVTARRKRTVGKMMQDAHNRNGVELDNVMLPRAEPLQELAVLCPRIDTIAIVETCHGELQYPYTEVTAANGFVMKTEPEECKILARRSFFDVVLNNPKIEASHSLL